MDAVGIVGARPQFVKAAIVSKNLRDLGVVESLIHTGQHYDHNMSDSFLTQLNIDNIALNLGVGSGSHGHQTAMMIEGIEKWVVEQNPKIMILYGDTNSTLAGAIVASKLKTHIAHVEAGARSFNRDMPEEINRVMVDHVSDLLLCSSDASVKNLESEGITKGVHCVGDVMLDAYRTFGQFEPLSPPELPAEPFVLATIHRPSNADSAEMLAGVVESLYSLGMPVIWPVHPRTRPNLEGVTLPDRIRLTEPLDYLSMLSALNRCKMVVTDSGGLQKEAYWAKKMCFTMRDDTEWVETLHENWNQLCRPGDDLYNLSNCQKGVWKPLYGDGSAGSRTANLIKDAIS